MSNYSDEQKAAMQARSQWDKKKLMAKALMDVVAGNGPDGDGHDYRTHYRIALAAWSHFCGGADAPYTDRRTKAFDQYMTLLSAVVAGRLRATMSIAPAAASPRATVRVASANVVRAASPRTNSADVRVCVACEADSPVSGERHCRTCITALDSYAALLADGTPRTLDEIVEALELDPDSVWGLDTDPRFVEREGRWTITSKAKLKVLNSRRAS